MYDIISCNNSYIFGILEVIKMKKVAYISYYILAILYSIYFFCSILIFNFPGQISKEFLSDTTTYIFVFYCLIYQIQEKVYEKYNERKNIYKILSIINIISIVIFLIFIFWRN